MADPPRELLTINEACELVKVSRRTMYDWIHKGWVDIERTSGNKVRIDAASLWRKKPYDPQG